MPEPRRLIATALLLALALLPACDRSDAGAPAPDPGSDAGSEPLRIVTLAPALTQMVVDLGRADALVGVTDKDTAAPSDAPELAVVGNYVALDHERLLTVRPTHVLQMAAKEGVSPGLLQLSEQAGFAVVAWRYPQNIADVADTLSGGLGGVPGLGEMLGTPQEAAAVRSAFETFFRDLSTLTDEGDRPRVLLVIGTGPIMASGPGTVHDELLRLAGGDNAAADATVTAPTYDREALLALDPQVVLVLSPGRQNVDAQAMATLLPELSALPIEAVERERVVLINDPATLLPSTSLPRIAAQIAEAVRPELAEQVDEVLRDYERAIEEAAVGGDEPRE